VAMLSSVLKSSRAIMINIKIIRVFSKLRTLLASHKDLLLKIEQLQKKDSEHDENILLIFKLLKKLDQEGHKPENVGHCKRIGFKSDDPGACFS
jgi:hypothetical protein